MRIRTLGIAAILSWAQGARADLAIAAKAPEFNLATLDGKRVSLAGHKGKIVVLDFWASWCGPCKVELPELERLKATYEARGVGFVAINLDKQRENAAAMASRLKLTLPIALDPDGEVADKYELPTMPSAFILDQTGTIRFVHAGFVAGDGEKIRKELDELLKKKL